MKKIDFKDLFFLLINILVKIIINFKIITNQYIIIILK